MKIERPLVLPVAVSLGAHALLLLGFTPAVPIISPVPDEPERLVAVIPVPPIEEEDPPLVTDKDSDPPEEKAVPVPGLPESIRTVDIGTPTMPPTKPVPYTGEPVTSIPVGPITSGDGLGPKGPPVFPSHLLDNVPDARYRIAPTYPFEAKRNSLTGEVVVEFVVNERGEVLSPRIVRSTDSVFEAPTLRAVSKWRFSPGKKDGRPVRFRMMVPIVFNLNE